MRTMTILAVVTAAALLVAGCLSTSDDDTGSQPDALPGFGPDVTPGGADAGGELGPGCLRIVVYRQLGATPPSEVRLAGSFEPIPWSGTVRLSDDDDDGFWFVETQVPAGEHQYKFIIDGDWVPDPDNPTTVEDGEGGLNSVMTHACPFTAPADGCLSDLDCDEDAPFCRYFACLGEEPPPVCQCEPGFECNAAGDCVPEAMIQCDDESPCDGDLVCRDGRCEPECINPDDCGDGSTCRDFVCFEIECEVEADCGDLLTETCDQGMCIDNPCALRLFTFDPGGEQYDSVHVAGEFNGWPGTRAEGGWAMAFLPDRGLWYVKQEVQNGSWQYKFVINDGEQWIADPTNPDSVDDTFGGTNSLLTVDCEDLPPAPGVCGDLEVFDWRDAVMYFAMVDRFYDHDGRNDPVEPGVVSEGDALAGASAQYFGGDLAGVTEKMPYLVDLGVTALWLSAPYDNRDIAGAAIDTNSDQHLYSGYHGYWPSPANVDYSDPDNPVPVPAVESRIGTADDLDGVVETAHASGVRVLFDYVMNHVDDQSGLYQAHPDWFARDGDQFALCGPRNLWDDEFWGTRCAFTDYLPPFDFDVRAARDWSVDDAAWWAKRFGIDGYRLDAIKHVPRTWLTDLRTRMNEVFPEPDGGRFYLVGETFAYDDANLIRSFVDAETMLDGQFDFPFKARLCEAVFLDGGRIDTFANWMSGNDNFYGPGSLMTTWIGNHDIPRAIHFASRQIRDCRQGSNAGNGWQSIGWPQPEDAPPYERLGVAFAVMMTNPGIPLIYYGDEIGLAGGGDPDNRRAMPWDDSRINAHQQALRQRVATLAQIRADNLVVARGRRVTLSSDADTWVYRMTGCGDAADVTVVINKADDGRSAEVPQGAYTDLMDDQSAEIAAGQRIELPARSFRVLRSE